MYGVWWNGAAKGKVQYQNARRDKRTLCGLFCPRTNFLANQVFLMVVFKHWVSENSDVDKYILGIFMNCSGTMMDEQPMVLSHRLIKIVFRHFL
jgi:hypothetical protein